MTAVFYGACTPFGNLFYIFLPHVWETEIDKIQVITGNGIGIGFRSNINNAKVPMIVYLKSLIFIAILRGNLGKSNSQNLKRINFSIWVKENFRSSPNSFVTNSGRLIVFGRHWRSDDWEFWTLQYVSPGKAKKKNVCLRSPDRPYFSAADPNLFYRQLFDPNFC